MTPSPSSRRTDDIEIRSLSSAEELAQAVVIQRTTWGGGFTEVVPATILQICQDVGGIAAGAFEPSGRMLGFVFGLTGVHEGRLVHWSHMLAVEPDARGRGLGKRLKLHQRNALLPLGVVEVRWSFDPLVAQNANLNINALGVEIEQYVPDMYGDDTGSELHSSLGTDRLVASWLITDPKVVSALAGHSPGPSPAVKTAPVANPAAALRDPLPDRGAARIEVPADIQQIKARSREAARAWRASSRHAFLHYLTRGYHVVGFTHADPEGRCWYLLARPRQ
jgi:predicted GNAT superfamily acetyltransferase